MYLIQRGKFKKSDHKKGIDSILKFDYMRSSEFEWGALPESLKRIRSNIKKYKYFDVNIKDKSITIFSTLNEKDIVKKLNSLANNEFHLKEFSAFDDYIKSSGSFRDKFDFWWDINGDSMFWKKNSDFKNDFKNLIK